MYYQIFCILALLLFFDFVTEEKNLRLFNDSAKWAILAVAVEEMWKYHIGPLAWWIVEIWRRGAV